MADGYGRVQPGERFKPEKKPIRFKNLIGFGTRRAANLDGAF
jgi:hypothetical protein